MDEDIQGRFVPVIRVGDVSRARILAARLEAEGIEVRLHSEALGPYPVTVGQMATTELWVPDDRLDAANAVLLDAEVNDVVGESELSDTAPLFPLRVIAVVVIAAALLAVVLRMMRVF